MGCWAQTFFQHLSACGGFQGLPARVSPATGRGHPRAGLGEVSSFTRQLQSPYPSSVAITASSVPCGSLGNSSGQAWQLPVTGYQHCWVLPALLLGVLLQTPSHQDPQGTRQQLWPVLRSSGLCEPWCLSLVIALPCPAASLKAGTSRAGFRAGTGVHGCAVAGLGKAG